MRLHEGTKAQKKSVSSLGLKPTTSKSGQPFSEPGKPLLWIWPSWGLAWHEMFWCSLKRHITLKNYVQHRALFKRSHSVAGGSHNQEGQLWAEDLQREVQQGGRMCGLLKDNKETSIRMKWSEDEEEITRGRKRRGNGQKNQFIIHIFKSSDYLWEMVIGSSNFFFPCSVVSCIKNIACGTI